MRKLRVFPLIGLILILNALVLAVPGALAGGWAVVTLDRLPAQIVAGEPVTVGFMVRQHGRAPAEGLEPQIRATLAETGQSLAVRAKAEGEAGHYAARLTFPGSGTWRWSIDAFSFAQPMPALNVLASAPASQTGTGFAVSVPLAVGLIGLVGAIGASLVAFRARTRLAFGLTVVAVAMSITGFAWAAGRPVSSAPVVVQSNPVAHGQALFLAKGCVVCHQHEAVREERLELANFSVGPDLTDFSADPAYLRLWLKDPSAVKSSATMPTLGLSPDEIEALIVFLNTNVDP